MNTHNAAQAIRDVLAELGVNASPKDVISRLKEERGIDVTPQQVSNEKSKLAKRHAGLDIDDLPVSVVRKVKTLVDEIGSATVVRQALDELESLTAAPNDTDDLELVEKGNWTGFYIPGASTTGNLKYLLVGVRGNKVSLWIGNARKEGGWEIIVDRRIGLQLLKSGHHSGVAPGRDGWGESGVERGISVDRQNDSVLLHIHDPGADRDRITISAEHLNNAMERLGLVE